ncbi:MAG: hypothetical protein AAGA85_20470 [Bacteroidota bacterium]
MRLLCTIICSIAWCLSMGQGLGISSKEYQQYWTFDGQPTLLLGGSVEDNLFQIEALEEHLDLLASVGGNYVRNTMSSRDEGNVWAFHLDEATGKYDLSKWNEEYWSRFERLLRLTSERKIVVQLEVWATFDFYRDNWDKNPFNPKNNSSFNNDRVKLPVEVKTHPVFTENPFFWSIPSQRHNIPLLRFQQAFVDRILDISLPYDHVLYCIDNETSVTSDWGAFWSDYIHKRAREANKQAYVTEMWDPHDLGHITHRETFDHPERYDFVEISQNNHQKGQRHWDNGTAQIERLRRLANLRPVTNVKTYGAEGGRHGHGTENGIQSFIRSVFFGSAAARFHRPPSGLGLKQEAQSVIQSVRMATDSMDFFRSKPAQEMLMDREANEAYVRAIEGETYMVYFTDGGEVTIQARTPDARGSITWLNVMESEWLLPRRIKGGRPLKVKAPEGGDWIAIVKF